MTLSPGAIRNLVVTIIFTVLAFFFICLRIFARFVVLEDGRKDEIAIIGSMISAIGLLSATVYEVKWGLGEKTATRTPEELTNFFHRKPNCLNLPVLDNEAIGLYVAIIFYNISLSLTKFSIVLQYLRVFTQGPTRLAAKFALIFIILYSLESICISIFACIPVSAFWDHSVAGHCVDKKFLWFFNASFNILTDLILLIVPMPALSKLFLPTKQKVLLMLLFGLGGFGCLVSVLRLQSLYIVSVTDDIVLRNADSSMWSNIEVNVGITCASLQTIRPVLQRCFPRLFTSLSRTQPNGGAYTRSHGNNTMPFNQAIDTNARFELKSSIQGGQPVRNTRGEGSSDGMRSIFSEDGDEEKGITSHGVNDRRIKMRAFKRMSRLLSERTGSIFSDGIERRKLDLGMHRLLLFDNSMFSAQPLLYPLLP
ncbi:hypothetical protein BJ875DRAFT_446670 [Amylocarpus encephaloides]|uniref:Rhodopsin domain-containing protein n=1 Tax=Amylocarpus encephaloides TaxID=45428 RepID=A0A9P7Y7Q6_9HELO|nr:hypothetical protein BJ875DRAFT_446670 [Amylocarpus encephaloides]